MEYNLKGKYGVDILLEEGEDPRRVLRAIVCAAFEHPNLATGLYDPTERLSPEEADQYIFIPPKQVSPDPKGPYSWQAVLVESIRNRWIALTIYQQGQDSRHFVISTGCGSGWDKWERAMPTLRRAQEILITVPQ